MLRYEALRYVMLCYVILWYAVLCCVVLCIVMLCYPMSCFCYVMLYKEFKVQSVPFEATRLSALSGFSRPEMFEKNKTHKTCKTDNINYLLKIQSELYNNWFAFILNKNYTIQHSLIDC